MKSKILHFVYINLCFIAFSCISDKYKETSVVPKKSSYSAATQTIEDVVIDFTNGSNEKYIMTFAMSGSQSDTSVAMILSTDKNIAKIKHTTNGSRNLVICYYAKGQIVSKDSVEITTSGAKGVSYIGYIFYLRNQVPYSCLSDGSNSKPLGLYSYFDLACFDKNAQKILYQYGNNVFSYDIDNKLIKSVSTASSYNKLYTNKTGNVCVDGPSYNYLYVFDSELKTYIGTFSPYYSSVYLEDKYLNIYNSPTDYECATISSSYSYNYYFYIDYTLNGTKINIASKSFSSRFYGFSSVKISPNSKYVSYIEYDGSNYLLKLYNISLKSTTTVFSSYNLFGQYCFNSDGTQIVLSAYNSSNSSNDLYVVNSTGGTATNITNSSNFDETSVDWK